MQERGQRKERIGVVTSNAMDKTITVSVPRVIQHPLYKKAIKRTKKFKAHDKDNACNVGDLVRISETRPLSKTKRWRMVEIVKRAE
ncbi:MAG: small subunit ribosomal protein [Candidatus Hydrogenedentes bacterium]|nr:small subunit ribosomal protein [Candidatus Hydrogenedentota bacterium]